MSSAKIRRTTKVWRVWIFAIAPWVIPSFLWCQTVLSSQQANASYGHPFAGFDETLSNTADTLLASATQATDKATGQTNHGMTQRTSFDLPYNRRLQFSGGGGQSAAAIRLNLLRPVVEPILRSHGIPTDLAAVILVESGGRATALSPKGARGLWQLMPDTARRYGLRVSEIQDDRLDLFKATDAAARYLHDLYAQFGDWKLALAAYNMGEANVGSAILRAHTQDFDRLTSLRMLPLETTNYVPRVLAAATSIGQPLVFGERRSLAGATMVFAVSAP
jgi:hypothetical protein